MKKLISPSFNTLKLVNGISVKFNANVLNTSKYGKFYLFIGKVVHLANELINKDNLNIIDAIRVSAMHVWKNDKFYTNRKGYLDEMNTPDNKEDTRYIMNTIVNHHLSYVVDYLSGKVVTSEIGLFTELNSKYDLGGTADIVIHNVDGTVSVADIKNYNNPSQADFDDHYKQCLLYGKLLEDNGFAVKDIQIIYPAQEQVITVPYEISRVEI